MMKNKALMRWVMIILFLFLLPLNMDKVAGNALSSPDTAEVENGSAGIRDISEKLIRFHVIANSDSEEDQRVKLMVRDEILKKLGSNLENCSSRRESLEFLRGKTKYIEQISDEILKKNDKSYSARAIIGNFDFPIKSYGNITLPPGKYTALRVILGEGGGRNWWCVMFPPLCFIDISRGLTTETTDKSLGKVLNKNELKSITNSSKKLSDTPSNKVKDKNSKPVVKLKFKGIEMLRGLFK